MKANMMFYAAAVVSFYSSLAVLYFNVASVLGLSLVAMGLACLLLGLICQVVAGRRNVTRDCTCTETAAASL